MINWIVSKLIGPKVSCTIWFRESGDDGWIAVRTYETRKPQDKYDQWMASMGEIGSIKMTIEVTERK